MVTSLLLDARHSSKIGYYSLFVYMHFLGERSEGRLVLPCVSGDPALLKSNTKVLGCKLDIQNFEDSQKSQVVYLIEQLIREGTIVESSRSMVSCSCGKVFYPSESLLHKTSSTLIHGETALCCGSTLVQRDTSVLQTVPITNYDLPACYPRWGGKELQWMRSNFRGASLVVSKQIQTSLTIVVGGTQYYIDNDLFLYLLPAHLQTQRNEQITDIVAGVSLVKQIALYLFFTSKLGLPLPMVHFLPRVNYVGNHDFAELINRYGSDTVYKKLLMCSISRNQIISFDDSGL